MLIELFAKPVGFFLIVMMIILITPLLSERLRLPGIIGIIIGGMLIGPHGFGLLADGDRIQFLSTIGLVYLMFSAGLEVDINQFMRVRTRALVFGLITFTVPQLMGMGLGYILGLDWLGMILLGSAFASHTLIAFPILTKLGVTRNEAVAVTIGATVMTDIGAFIVLAVVLGANKGGLSFGYFAQLFVLLALLTGAIIFGLPRLGKFIFQKINSRAVEFQFVIVTLFVAAFAAELIGVHEVVGAFLAGLAVNSMLPRHSPVAGHVLFIGESFFIPVFLLYSGLITDPLTFLKSPQTMIVALGVTIVAYVSKLISAWITARIYKYTKSEFWTVYGLSHAQAAVTIPTLVIGLETGLFDSTLFNAAILMILLTSITSPLIVQRFAPNLQTVDVGEKQDSIFSRVLVPLADTQNSEGLVSLASLLARSTHGKVLAVSVARDSGLQSNDSSFTMHRDLLGRVTEIFNDPETEIELIPRMASSHAQGILHTAHEKNASLIVMGWRGKRTLRENVLGSVLDEVVWGSDTPVMVGKLPLPLNSMQHVVFVVPAKAVPPIILRRMLDANLTLAKALNVPLIVRADSSYLQNLEALAVAIKTDHPIQIEVLTDQLKPEILEHEAISSFIVLPGFGSRKRVADTLGNLPEQLAKYFDGNLAVLHFDK